MRENNRWTTNGRNPKGTVGKVGTEVTVSAVMDIGDSFKNQVINRCKCVRKIKLSMSINLAISSNSKSDTTSLKKERKRWIRTDVRGS